MLLHLVARNLLLATAIYLGMYQGFVGIRWLVAGAVWVLFFTHLAVLYSPVFLPGQPDTRPRLVRWTSWLFDVAVVAALLYSKAYATAVAYVASCICLSLVRERKGFPLKPVKGPSRSNAP